MFIHSDSSVYEVIKTLSSKIEDTVYLALKKNPHYPYTQKVILKVFDSAYLTSYSLELESLLKVRSAYCLSILHFENIYEKAALVLEWVDGINLSQLQGSSIKLNEREINCVCHQIQLGLLDLNKSGLCHGDLSLHNVMLDKYGCVRLIDFGKGNYMNKHVYGTTGFIAKEVLEGQQPDFNSDLFSLGMIEEVLRNHDTVSLPARENPLLNPNPLFRKMKTYFFYHGAQRQLGNKVQRVSNKLTSTEPTTDQIPKGKKVVSHPLYLSL